MNREVYHEGWLVKSPPLKRIWKARWRRRWFTLKQGELPGQFFLEYYTDRNCRKQKGVIDLDQCEQVDAGLRKTKLPYMFDVKTPKRTYYLAADTDEELKGWVNCICQVCGLQDLTRQGVDRHYFDIGATNATSSSTNDSSSSNRNTLTQRETNFYTDQHNDSSCVTESTNLSNSVEIGNTVLRNVENQIENLSINNTYQNDDFLKLQSAEYCNRETLVVCDNRFNGDNNKTNEGDLLSNNNSSETYDTKPIVTGTIRKIPENLKLSEIVNDLDENAKPSPSLSTCSGPYIPISECFSGSPILPPNHQLNSLDPKFYDTPRSHNIGLNLTDDQPYSPKRNNCSISQSRSGHSSPTDSESVFTDDEWSQTESIQGTLDRKLRPSDSSIENEAIGWTYVQRFSRVDGNQFHGNGDAAAAPPRPPKRVSVLVLNESDKSKENQTSDTENASPAIGPKDSSCFVEQSYDIPRSYRYPSQNNNTSNNIYNNASTSPKFLSSADITAQSTPNLMVVDGYVTRTNCYTNAAPTKVEGSVFRYDFIEQPDAPAVDRTLKPKSTNTLNRSTDSVKREKRSMTASNNGSPNNNSGTLKMKSPPSVHRNLKPQSTYDIPKALDTNSMKRRGIPYTAAQCDFSDDDTGSLHGVSQMFVQDRNSHSLRSNSSVNAINDSSNKSGEKPEKLQYLDLDHSDCSALPSKAVPMVVSKPKIATSTLPRANHRHGSSSLHSTDKQKPIASSSSASKSVVPSASGTVYKTVDFVKTEAFKRTRQDVEMTRQQLSES